MDEAGLDLDAEGSATFLKLCVSMDGLDLVQGGRSWAGP